MFTEPGDYASIIHHPRYRPITHYNLGNVLRGVQHTIARIELAGRKVDPYHKGYVEEYTKELITTYSPILAAAALGMIYMHLRHLDKGTAQ